MRTINLSYSKDAIDQVVTCRDVFIFPGDRYKLKSWLFFRGVATALVQPTTDNPQGKCQFEFTSIFYILSLYLSF